MEIDVWESLGGIAGDTPLWTGCTRCEPIQPVIHPTNFEKNVFPERIGRDTLVVIRAVSSDCSPNRLFGAPNGSSPNANSEAPMGKQVNFYMSADDEREFVEFVRGDRNVGFFKFASPSPEIPLVEELPTRDQPFSYLLFLWDRDHSPVPSLYFVKEQGYYVVSSIEAEVIEFSRSFLDDGRLIRGRIWAEMNGRRRDDPATMIKKSDSFSKWFDRLAAWIKRRATRNAVGDYLLPGASTFAARGGQLCHAVLSSGKAL